MSIPNSVVAIGDFAFTGCINLTHIVIPEGVESIGIEAFSFCNTLKNISLPKSLKFIGEYAFRYSENISDVFYSGTEKQWNDISIYGYNSSLLVANIHFTECKDHLFDEWKIIVEPTYTTTGEKTRECKNCSEVETVVIPVLEETTSTPDEPTTENPDVGYEEPCADGHTWSTWAVTTAATCKKDGVKTRNCTICGAKETESIPATGVCSYKWVVTKEVTATEYGEKVRICTVCGDIKESQKINKLECDVHEEYGEYVVINPATCTEDGIKTKYCLVCNHIETESIPATGHNYTWYTISVATCETDGVMLGECSICEDIDVKATLKTGHNIIDGICENCGYTENVEDDDNNNNTNDNENNNENDNNEVVDPSDDCSCNCHKSGIQKFFFNFALFFQRIFGSNKVCDCGVAHY